MHIFGAVFCFWEFCNQTSHVCMSQGWVASWRRLRNWISDRNSDLLWCSRNATHFDNLSAAWLKSWHENERWNTDGVWMYVCVKGKIIIVSSVCRSSMIHEGRDLAVVWQWCWSNIFNWPIYSYSILQVQQCTNYSVQTIYLSSQPVLIYNSHFPIACYEKI